MRIIITFLAFFVFVSFCNAQQFDIGEINDAKYRIYIPENWNKGLVIYCHGYQEIGEEIDPLIAKLDDFVKILTHPRSALIKQYTALLSAENVELEFNNAAIRSIAKIASDVNAKMENIGARRLHTVMTTLLEKPLYEQPKRGEKKIKITAKIVKESLEDILEDQDLSRYIL